MSLLRWLARRFPNAPIHRVAGVVIEDNQVVLVRATGVRESVPWTDIARIVIRTTDKGPFDDDVFLVIETSSTAFQIPQSAPETGTLLQVFQEWDGFRNEPVIEAMGCCDNAEFVCWEREST